MENIIKNTVYQKGFLRLVKDTYYTNNYIVFNDFNYVRNITASNDIEAIEKLESFLTQVATGKVTLTWLY